MAVEAAAGEEVTGVLGLWGGQLLGEPGLGQTVGVQETLASAGLDAAGDLAAVRIGRRYNPPTCIR